jgi:putative spermidine/putrescine transport system ATP-binding protein
MSSLDAVLREEMRAELAAILHHEGVTAVYVTHDRSEALSVADRVAVLRDGRLVQTGTPQECYDRPTTPFVATFLGPAHLIPAQVTALHHDVGGRLLHLATPLGGPVPARGPEGVSAGQTGQWLLRPEQLVLEPPKMLPALTWQAVVTRSTYQGGCWKVQLQSATGLAITTVARRPLSQGEALTVFALADEPWFVPDHGAVRAPVPA